MCAAPGTNILILDGMFSAVDSQNYCRLQKTTV